MNNQMKVMSGEVMKNRKKIEGHLKDAEEDIDSCLKSLTLSPNNLSFVRTTALDLARFHFALGAQRSDLTDYLKLACEAACGLLLCFSDPEKEIRVFQTDYLYKKRPNEGLVTVSLWIQAFFFSIDM